MDTSGKIQPHSEVKLTIFENYLDTMLYKIKSPYRKTTVIDAFAGQGEDSEGKKGSAKIIIETINKHFTESPFEYEILLNDLNENYILKINNLIKNMVPSNSHSKYIISSLDATLFLENINKNASMKNFSFLFYDPFGYSLIKKNLIIDFLEKNYSEILMFIPFSNIYRFLNKTLKTTYYADEHKLCDFLTDVFGKDYKSLSVIGEFDFFQKLVTQFKAREIISNSILIQEGGNKYGLIFFSRKPIGNNVFLNACYKKFTIPSSLSYFKETNTILIKIHNEIKPKKHHISQTSADFMNTIPPDIKHRPPDPDFSEINAMDYSFFNELREKTITNKQLYFYILSRNLLPQHVISLLKKMEKDELLCIDRKSSKIKTGYYYLNDNEKTPTFDITFAQNFNQDDFTSLSFF